MRRKHYPPVFILSCERSGSTMLRYIMDTHSMLTCPGHLYIGNLCQSLNQTLMWSIAQTHTELDEEGKIAFSIKETRKTILNIMKNYALAKGKKMWCEKTPMNLSNVALLNEHFPDAKYICLYRHCMDVVHSSLNLSKYKFLPEHIPYIHRNPGNIVAAMTENWIEKTEILLEFEKSNQDRCFRVKYESIVETPNETLMPLFDFLEVGWEYDLIDRVFKINHEKGEGDGRAVLSSKICQNSIGKGVDVPKAGIPDKFLSKMDRLLCELGYDKIDQYYRRQSNIDTYAPHNSNNMCSVFENHIKRKIKENKINYPLLDGLWKIIVSGGDGGIWIIDLSGQEAFIVKEDINVDFTLSLSSSLLKDLFAGIRDGVEAFSQGEIKVEGEIDADKLLNFGKLFFS